MSLQAGRIPVLMARAYQLVGMAGLAGVVLLVCAAVVLTMAWPHRDGAASHLMTLTTTTTSASITAKHLPSPGRADQPFATANAPALPGHADIALLVTQMEHAALGNGLAWPAAEFRTTSAAAQATARLEARFTLKGPYPQLRSMLAQLLTTVPGLTLGELSMTRASSDAVDVQGKLAIVVFLADEAPTNGPQSRGSR